MRDWRRVLSVGSAAAALLAFAAVGTARAQPQQQPTISYAEVLADPDNINLSLLYAQQRINDGELQKATVSLERVLLLDPDNDRARLLFAIVLYRLGSFAEAEAELKTLQGRELSPSDTTLVEKYLGLISEKERRWSAEVMVGLGTHYDTNRNSHPASDQIRAANTIFVANGDEEDDFGFLGFLAGEFAYKLSPVKPGEIFVSGALIADEQIKLDNLDLIGFVGKTGIRTTVETFNLEWGGGLTVAALDEESFLDIYEFRFKGSRAFKDGATIITPYLEIFAGFEDFHSTSNSPQASEDDGVFYGLEVGGDWNLTRSARMGVHLGVRRKDAETDFNSYWRTEGGVDAAFVLADDTLLKAFASLALEDYEDPDPFISTTEVRRDHDLVVGMDLVQRLDPLFEAMGLDVGGTFASGIAATIGWSYENANSNLDNFEFDNIRARALITKRITF